MIVNHLEKIFVTSDAATIMQEVTIFKSVNDTLFRLKSNTPPRRCWLWHLPCKNVNVEIVPPSWLPWVVNFSRRPKFSSRWAFIPPKFWLVTKRQRKKSRKFLEIRSPSNWRTSVIWAKFKNAWLPALEANFSTTPNISPNWSEMLASDVSQKLLAEKRISTSVMSGSAKSREEIL